MKLADENLREGCQCYWICEECGDSVCGRCYSGKRYDDEATNKDKA